MEVMTAYRFRRAPSPPDRRPRRRGGGSSPCTYAASAAGRAAGPARLSGGRRGLLRSARALTAAALLALAGALVLPAAAQTTDPVWSAIMTVGETNYGPGYDVNEDEGGSLSDDDFQYSSTTYTVELIELDDSYAVSFRVDTDGLPEEDTLTLEIDGLAFPFEDRSNGDEAYWEWDVPEDLSNSDLPIGDRVVVCLRTAAQVCPTSVPSALSVADVSAEEGEDLTFTVELTPASTETVTVDWATSGGTATSGTDFTAGTATLTFTAGDTEQTVTVATTEDMTEEDHETITVTLSNATAATISGATATGVIWNDDGTSATDPVWSTVMTVARTMFHGHGYADPEVFGDAGTFGSLSDNDFDHLSVTYEVYYVEVHPGDGVSFGVDLAGLPEDYALTLEIDGHAFPFEERRDASSASLWEWDVPEDLIDIGTALPIGDRVVVCLRGGAQVCPTSVPSALSVADVSAEEGEDLTFTVELSPESTETVTVDWATSEGTAEAGTDFTAGTGTLTFAPGVTEQTVTVATIEDMTDEDHETITVTLSNASAPISGATATGTIKNDDAPPLVWSTTLTVGNHMTGSGNYYGYLSESSTGSLTDTDFEYRSTTYAVDLVTVNTQGEVYFFVDLAGLPEEDTMTLEINGHEFPFEDRESESSNLAWVWDAPEELDEPATEFPVGSMATVCLRTATQVCPTGGIVIPPTVTVADGTATEGSPVTFTVTLSALSGLDVEVDYATTETDPQSAVSGTDFTAASGTLEIEAGNRTGTIEVQTTEDDASESAETFTLTISDPDNATLGAKVAATGTIEDDDANAAPTFSSSATFDAAENQTTAGTVLATDGDTDDDVTGYAITGGADQAFFLIGATSGALTFDDAPNFEDAEDQGANNTYVVEVQATSGTGAREKMATQAITVTVADVDGEKPTAPAAPNVSAASVTSLNVNWTAPANAGPAITDYDVQYRAGTSGGWTDRGYDATATTATITSLAAGTSYQVQVRATNAEGTGDWSASGAGSTYANEAEAQEIALVSNIREAPSGEAAATPENYTGGQESRVAQRFTTGPSTGYGLQSVLLNLTESEGQGGGRVKVGIHRNKDSGNPGRELVVLDNPDPVFGTNRPFSVTSPFSLDAGTSYWVVVSNTGSNRSRFFVSVTASGNETTTQEFEIGDSRNAGKPGSWTDISGEPARMEIRGTVPAQKNPTLSGLSLGTGVMLNPVFASGTTVYTASVPNAVDEVTVTPTKAAASATIEYLNESDMPLTGASTEAGHRVALAVGNTVIKVKVTAADRSTTQTYTVTMTRDAAIPGICSLNTGDLWCGVVTVAEAKYPFGSSLEVTEGYGFTHNDFRAYDAGMLSDTTFALGLNEYTITRILVAVGRSAGTLSFGLAGTGGLPAADIANLELHAGASSFAFSTATYFDQQDANLYAWSDSGLSWSVDDTVTLRLRRRAGGDMPTNNAPVFAATTATRTVPENSTAGTNVGDPVTATDDAGDTLEYSLEGTDATSFAVDSASGQITTIANVDYNHEATKKSYSVTVKASDGTESATIAVTINVTDVAGEAPGKPNAPDVSAASVTSLTVSWSAPANAGPAITDYDVQYREGATGDWSNGNHTGAATTATLSSLSENTSYQVQVRATNDEGTGSWSDSSSGTTDANAAPSFTSSATFDAAENGTEVTMVRAEDSDSEDKIERYDITGGADQAFFLVIASSGHLEFRDAPNFEDAQDQGTDNTYVVEVEATSGTGTREKTATQTITVTVTDVAGEAPGKPNAPDVSAASVTSLTVSWSAPANAGPAITDYDVQYREGATGDWSNGNHTGAATTATLSSLSENTSYQVQVRATNDEGTGSWSDSSSGTTDANAAPSFTSSATFDAAENGTEVTMVRAEDSDSEDKIERYDITGGADQAFFLVIASSGHLEFRDAPNFEDAQDQGTDNTYVVEVEATSGTGTREKTATQTITVTVTDVAGEAPGKPNAPDVSAASVTSLTVSWSAPANAGPAITDYDVQYREGATGDWSNGNHTGAATTATLSSLSENTSYQVQVRATNDEGTGSWSDSSSGTTDANAAPSFTSSATFDAAENGTEVTMVRAEDSDSEDKIERYDITGGADQAFFLVIASSGHLEFRDAPNFEDAEDQGTDNTYVVEVEATSGTGTREKTATQTITVTVTDVSGEKPAAPAAPTVAAASVTSLTVNWSAPANAGPAITDYDVQYRAGATGDWSNGNHTGAATTATLSSLSENTSYQVQVRATNDEGTGSWSDSSSGTTDANAAPSFTSSATFDAAENGTEVTMVRAEDSDSEDKIERYDITGGADQAFFLVIASSGHLEFRDAPNFEDAQDQGTDNTYVVEVEATSGTGTREKTATQTITVTVTDVAGEAPGKPNAPDVSAASVTSLTVSWSAPANAGPAITDYDVQYRAGATGDWSNGNHTGAATTATLSSLSENTSYQVQVRATNDEGTGSWSDSSSGTTDANAAPSFTSSATFDAAENGTEVTMVRAEDSDSEDKIERYDITGGADQAFFLVIASSGHLEFRDAPNFEDAQDQGTDNTYVVEVEATSGTGTREKTATQTITVTVTDVAGEAPGKPNAPDVSAASVTSLTATWLAPANAGPAIDDYDVQYREGATGDWSNGGHTGAATTATLSGLSENTSYQVQVRATNDEGTGSWSDSGSGATNAETPDAPTITAVAVTSTPQLETDTYGEDETIEVSVTFSEAVNATSDTDFVLSVSGDKRAPLVRGSGTTTLAFGYTVASSDDDDNGIWIGDQDRTLAGDRDGNPQNGAIASAATSAAADLAHDALDTLSGHKVDGSRTPTPDDDDDDGPPEENDDEDDRTPEGDDDGPPEDDDEDDGPPEDDEDDGPPETPTTPVAPPVPHTTTPARLRIRALDADADSMSLHMSWRAPEANAAAVTGYRFRVFEGPATRRVWPPVVDWTPVPEPLYEQNGRYEHTVRLSVASAYTVWLRAALTNGFSDHAQADIFYFHPVGAESEERPERVALIGNYPNPFNPSTEIVYELPGPGPVRLVVYDMIGREVQVLADAHRTAGRHTARFDAEGLPTGTYAYTLTAGSVAITRVMVLVR